MTGGVDTRAEMHAAGVADQTGRALEAREFPAAADGFGAALAWMRAHTDLARPVWKEPAVPEGTARYLAVGARTMSSIATWSAAVLPR